MLGVLFLCTSRLSDVAVLAADMVFAPSGGGVIGRFSIGDKVVEMNVGRGTMMFCRRPVNHVRLFRPGTGWARNFLRFVSHGDLWLTEPHLRGSWR